MATKPSNPATTIPWATDATFTSGTDAGQVTKVAPLAGEAQQGCVPGTSAVGPLMNYLFNQFYQWVLYLYDGLLTGVLAVTDASVRAFSDFEYCDGTGAATTKPRTKQVMLTACSKTGPSSFTKVIIPSATPGASSNYLGIGAPAAGDGWSWDVVLPFGAVPTSVSVGVSQTNAAASNMTLNVYRNLTDSSAGYGSSNTLTSLGASDTTGGVTSGDILTVATSGYTQNTLNTLTIHLATSNSGAGIDAVHWVTVSFSDPGPRNF